MLYITIDCFIKYSMNGRKRLLDIIIIRLMQKLLKTCQIDHRLLLDVKLRFELYSILKCAHCNAKPGLEKKKDKSSPFLSLSYFLLINDFICSFL